jgi:hypothetical protein
MTRKDDAVTEMVCAFCDEPCEEYITGGGGVIVVCIECAALAEPVTVQ